MEQPHRAPGYPVAPALTLVAMIALNLDIFAIFALILAGGYMLFRVFSKRDA